MVSLIVAAEVQAQVQLLKLQQDTIKLSILFTCSKMQMTLWLRYTAVSMVTKVWMLKTFFKGHKTSEGYEASKPLFQPYTAAYNTYFYVIV